MVISMENSENKVKNTLNQEKVNYKMLIIFIGFALAAGFLGALLGGNMASFKTLKKPFFAPPPIVFPIVWTILYILMGISSYLICCNKTDKKFKKRACFFYLIQLLVNTLWSLFFFRLGWLFFAFLWLLLLVVLVIIMIIKFYKLKPLAAYLQIPYLLWLIIAGILNISIVILN